MSKVECNFCMEEVEAIDLELMQVPMSKSFLWACDECRKITKEAVKANDNDKAEYCKGSLR